MAWFDYLNSRVVSSTIVHAQAKYHVIQFGHSLQAQSETEQTLYTNYYSPRYDVNQFNVPMYCLNEAGAITTSSFSSDIYLVIWWGGYMQQWKLTGWIVFAFRKGDDSGAVTQTRPCILVFDRSIPNFILIQLLSSEEVHCRSCNVAKTILWHTISSPIDVSAGTSATLSVSGLPSAGTFYSNIPYWLSLSLM